MTVQQEKCYLCLLSCFCYHLHCEWYISDGATGIVVPLLCEMVQSECSSRYLAVANKKLHHTFVKNWTGDTKVGIKHTRGENWMLFFPEESSMQIFSVPGLFKICCELKTVSNWKKEEKRNSKERNYTEVTEWVWPQKKKSVGRKETGLPCSHNSKEKKLHRN